MVLVSNLDSYLTLRPPDCSLYSEDGQVFEVHKEVLSQTRLMRSVISNVRQDCCCNQKLEFVFDALEKDDLEDIVQFLYSGQILFTDQAHAAKVLANLTKYLGFPEMVNPEGDIKQEGIKVDEDIDLTFDYARKVGDKLFKKENSYPMDFPDFYPEKAAHNCHYCGKGFSYKKGLRRHLRQMHEPVSIKSEMDEDPDWQIGEPLTSLQEESEESGDFKEPFVYDPSRPTMVTFPSALTFPTLDSERPFKPPKAKKPRGEGPSPSRLPGICPHCGEYFKHLQVHIENKHDEKKGGTCPQCGEYYKRLQQHISYKHENGRGGVCPQCGVFYKMLQQHIQAKHTLEKPFKCDQCEYAHATKSGLKQHVVNSHPKDEDMKICQVCGASFVSKGNLKQHMEAIHEKKRDFACNVCDAKFYFKHKMEEHVKAKHLGEKNFKCEKCDMAFACNSLRYHHIQKVHDGIEFRCHLCGKDFAYKKGLRRHIKNVHDGAQLLDARRRLHHSQIPTYNNSPMTLSPTHTS